MNTITIVMTTWLPPGAEKKRLEAMKCSVSSWSKNLNFDGKINLHVADDGTVENLWGIYLHQTIREAWGDFPTYSKQERKGVGASLNTGLKRAFQSTDVVLHAVDDWELLSPLDLTPWYNFLHDKAYSVGMIRFFAHPDLTGTIRFIPPHGWAIALDRHHYVFSFRPCLWHKRFFDNLGYFEEGVSAIDAEQIFNNKLTGRQPQFEGENIWLALPEQWRHLDPVTLSDITPS